MHEEKEEKKESNSNTNTNSNTKETGNPSSMNESLLQILSMLSSASGDRAKADNPKIDNDLPPKLLGIMSRMQGSPDSRAQLFHSMKPFLNDNRKEKADQIIKVLKMITLAQIIMENKELFL